MKVLTMILCFFALVKFSSLTLIGLLLMLEVEVGDGVEMRVGELQDRGSSIV